MTTKASLLSLLLSSKIFPFRGLSPIFNERLFHNTKSLGVLQNPFFESSNLEFKNDF